MVGTTALFAPSLASRTSKINRLCDYATAKIAAAAANRLTSARGKSMSDPFKELVEQMARLSVPEDDTEENWERRETAASESGTPTS